MSDYPVAISLEKGLELLLPHCKTLPTEQVTIDSADHRVLAAAVIAQESIPPFPRSPYDGYALRSADTQAATRSNGVVLSIIEEVPAGHAPTKTVAAGQAVKILTGAPIPDGADAVVKFEDTKFTAEIVTVFQPCRSGDNIVPAGEDIQKGETVMERGTILSPARIGILAGLGLEKVNVYRRPVISLLSTGDELVETTAPLLPGKIRNSSIHTLAAYLSRFGAVPYLRGIVADDEDAIAAALKDAAEGADIVVTTGGVSVGDYDLLRKGLEKMGATILFWKVRMKPGSAFVAAVWKDCVFLCLSGNPSAAAVALFLLGVPALRKMQGYENTALEKVTLRLAKEFPKKSPNRRFIPGHLCIKKEGAFLVTAERQGNGMLHPLDGCTLLGEIPAGSDRMAAGSEIEAYCLPE